MRPFAQLLFMNFTLKRHDVEVRSGRSRVDWSLGFPLLSSVTPNSQAGDSCRCFLSGVCVCPGKPRLLYENPNAFGRRGEHALTL